MWEILRWAVGVEGAVYRELCHAVLGLLGEGVHQHLQLGPYIFHVFLRAEGFKGSLIAGKRAHEEVFDDM